jgi:hypothetical protein
MDPTKTGPAQPRLTDNPTPERRGHRVGRQASAWNKHDDGLEQLGGRPTAPPPPPRHLGRARPPRRHGARRRRARAPALARRPRPAPRRPPHRRARPRPGTTPFFPRSLLSSVHSLAWLMLDSG